MLCYTVSEGRRRSRQRREHGRKSESCIFLALSVVVLVGRGNADHPPRLTRFDPLLSSPRPPSYLPTLSVPLCSLCMTMSRLSGCGATPRIRLFCGDTRGKYCARSAETRSHHYTSSPPLTSMTERARCSARAYRLWIKRVHVRPLLPCTAYNR